MKELSSFLSRIARTSASHPWTVLMVAIVLTLGGLVLVSRLDIKMNTTSLVPEDFPAVKEYKEGMKGFEHGKFIFAILESPEGIPVSEYRSFITNYKQGLKTIPAIKSAQLDISKTQLSQVAGYLRRHAMALLSPADLKELNDRL